MDGEWGSSKLKELAEQLRAYKAPANFCGEEDSEDGAAGIASSVGVLESAAVCEGDAVFRSAKRAAVLVCIFQNEEGDFRVILTRRAKSLTSHSGEVAFPGGKRDENDTDDVATALREAKEEIGLDPSLVRVVTLLEPFLSKHLLRVIPVVALLCDRSRFNPTPNKEEVDAIFDAPLEMFLKDEQHQSEERDWLGYRYRVHYFNYESNEENFMIWGLTAAILIRCASVIYQCLPSFGEPFSNVAFPKNSVTTEPKL